MICGVAVHVAGLYLPAADLIVLVSVLIAGLMLIVEERIPPAWWMAVFVAAGLFHGYSHGDSIDAAKPMPLIAYLTGLAAVQMIMTVGVAFATRGLWKLWNMAPRLAGAAFCGVGFAAFGHSAHPQLLKLHRNRGKCEDGPCKRKFALATEPSRSKRPAKSGLHHSLDPNNRIVVINREFAWNLGGDFFHR
jgi:hypothetical protein